MKIDVQEAGKAMSKMQITLEPADYVEEVNKELKKIRKNIQMPGFRPGKVPMNLIAKKYGDSVKVEILTKLLQDAIMSYMENGNIHLIGNVIPDDKTNWEEQLSQENPSFSYWFSSLSGWELPMDELKKIPLYQPLPDDELLDEYVDLYRKQEGINKQVDQPGEDTFLTMSIQSAEDDSEAKDLYFFTLYKDIVENKSLVDAYNELLEKKEISGTFRDILKRFELEKKLKEFYDEKALSTYKDDENVVLKLTSLTKREKAALDETLYEKIFPGREIKTEEAFRQAIAEKLENQFIQDGKTLYHQELYRTLMEDPHFPLSPEFLEKYLQYEFPEKSPEEIKQEMEDKYFQEHMKFQSIMSKFLDDQGIEIDEETLKDAAAEETLNLLKKYNMAHLVQSRDELVNTGLKWINEDDNFRSKVFHIANVNMFFKKLEELLNPEPERVSLEEFYKILKDRKADKEENTATEASEKEEKQPVDTKAAKKQAEKK